MKKTRKLTRRQHLLLRFGILIAVVIAIVVGVSLGYHYATYDHAKVVKQYERKSTDDSKYIQYEDGVLEYSRDGIAFLTYRGDELWNQPCQIGNPIVETCEKAAAVGDKGGTSILVFQKTGLKGEIQTTRPIEKISVSSQGIVAAVLQDEETPFVVCYDAKGKVLVEQKASLKNTGYPTDVALSEDGKTLLVSYLCTRGYGIFTKVRFYYFGEAGQTAKDYVVSEYEYDDSVVPTVRFLDENTSLAVSDSELMFYKGDKKPKEMAEIPYKGELQSIAYSDDYVAITLKKSGKEGNELQLYRLNGKLVMSTLYEGEYTNLKVTKDQVVLYEDAGCLIFNASGVQKFKGTLEKNIVDIFRISGFNKYMMINAAGFEQIQLAK